ncbi:hypothetical protein TrRE_jg9468 [Triparma retinervis]|uniref:AB hydrolase-1 domain-containing protein n=1 Tax=Triparma retinervis TaxID=2557542 RepID=A0A9W6ZG26_9STRA|nr:hypothetical protein TrRE_jg9468 [Triparma retinervis]
MAGLMGSRLEGFRKKRGGKQQQQQQQQRKLLVTIDRPGLGCTPTWGEGGGTRYTRVADAVLHLVEKGLGIGDNGIEVVGWSSGGAYALAIGAQGGNGKIIKRVATVASDPQWATVSWATLLSNPGHIGLFAVVKLGVPKWIIGRGALLVVELLQGLGSLLDLEPLRLLNCNFGESMKNHGSALAVAEEIQLERSEEWGFSLEDCCGDGVDVTIYHSRGDRLVPFAASGELHGRIGGGKAEIKELPPGGFRLFEEGHLIMEEYWDKIVEDS